ncbi:MAG: hypothetical protein WBD46_05220 [Acidobacteriaceae bacterium]
MRRSLGLLTVALLVAGCGGSSNPSSTTSTSNPTSPTTPSTGSGSGTSTTAAATYVYVSNAPSSTTFQVNAYTVGSNGALTAVSGSPFPTSGQSALYLAATGSTLFGSDGYTIYSYAVASNGSIKQENSLVSGEEQNGQVVGGPLELFFDPPHANLYSFYNAGPGTTDYGAYSFNPSNGQLATINLAGGSAENTPMLAFSANDQYAYTADAYHGSPAITEFSRASNGALTQVNQDLSFTSPTAPAATGFLPYGAASDGSNHIIVAMGQETGDDFTPNGPWQLAVYTPGSDGTLTTTSTYQNMTTINVGENVNWYSFSPDDKYFAVAGTAGLQVFSYNSASQTFTAIGAPQDTGNNFWTLSWDANDHLYAIAIQSNSLYAYTVSATAVTAVPGSPYSIQNPQSVTTLSQSSGSGS